MFTQLESSVAVRALALAWRIETKDHWLTERSACVRRKGWEELVLPLCAQLPPLPNWCRRAARSRLTGCIGMRIGGTRDTEERFRACLAFRF